MGKRVRARFWAELALLIIAIATLVLTYAAPDWVEIIFGLDPDQGGGAFEWAFAAVAVTGLVAAWLAPIEWRRSRPLIEARGIDR